MDIFGIGTVLAITVLAYLVGQAVKAMKIDNKWIPIICGAFGIVVGVAGFLIGMPDYPANDVITAAAVGAASGLSATGINQVYKQLTTKYSTDTSEESTNDDESADG